MNANIEKLRHKEKEKLRPSELCVIKEEYEGKVTRISFTEARREATVEEKLLSPK